MMQEKFWQHLRIDESGCWIWLGQKGVRGYGRVLWNGRRIAAHRVAYLLTCGPIPDGLVVMHMCDVPPCINPAHLQLGTVKDNNLDMHAKGRGRNQTLKLTHEMIDLARGMLRAGVKPREVASAFGVCRETIGRLASGRSHKGSGSIREPKSNKRLSEEAARAIKYASINQTTKELSKLYNVSEPSIRSIRNGKTWAALAPPQPTPGATP